MSAQPNPVAEAPPSLKAFLLTAVLWLPLAFFLTLRFGNRFKDRRS